MSKVIITDHCFPSIDLQKAVLEPAGFDVKAISPICKTEDDVIEKCKGAEVLLVQWAPVTRRVLEALPEVKCIVRYGVGVNNFDLEAAKDLGVTAANVPDFCVEEVSNHAMAMIVSLCRRIPQDHNQIVKGGWGIGDFRPIPAFTDLTIGLVSFGQIARLVAQKAKCFGFNVIAFDPLLADEVFNDFGVKRVDMDTLLRKSDIVSLHCPLVPATTHLIDREAIAKMKPGAILVNTSRGPVVDEPAMIEALKSGQLGGAGLDVFEVEPLPAGSPLRDFNNVILTSHAASVSEKAVDNLQIKAAEAARDFLLGKRPSSVLV
ncbi:MAG: C-terminal binding protein [Armatimonadetes bacterium]|nr:C-terminal binding protein [Armatimonadota bacterium]